MPRILAVDVYQVAMPLKYPWRTAYGEDHTIETVLLRLETSEGIGWGESSPLPQPHYVEQWSAAVFLCLQQCLVPAVLGRSFGSPEELQQAMAFVKGNTFAKAALDLAWWDAAARAQQKPLYQLLGGTREQVPVGADFGVMDHPEELLPLVEEAVAQGFPRVKLKFRPGWDLPVVQAVRERFPELVLHIDCNAGYTLRDAELFEQLDRFRLAMFEQPLGYDDLWEHAQLQRRVQTPVCLDESVRSLHLARQALALGSCRWINIKPGRVGGLTVAREVLQLAAEHSVPCWVGGMLESALGARHCVALGTLPGMDYPADIFPSDRFYEEDLGDPPLVLERDASGRPVVCPLEAPGTGTEPRPDLLRRWTVNHFHAHA